MYKNYKNYFINLHKNSILYYINYVFVLSLIVEVDFLGVLFALVFFFSCGNSCSRAGVASLGLPRPRLTTAALDIIHVPLPEYLPGLYTHHLHYRNLLTLFSYILNI